MKPQITPQPGILQIAPYVGGGSKLAGQSQTIKLSSNENPLGPSPKAIAAYKAAAEDLAVYPSSDHSDLRQAIAQIWRLDAERIICGSGSDEILAFLCQAYAGEGDEVLYCEHGFAMYRIYAQSVGATPVAAPEKSRKTDVDKILAYCSDKTRLVFLANPNNPTGTMISKREIKRLACGLPPKALLVLDGAYAEFIAEYDGGAALVEESENVVMTRTFSKIYGLGALRIGWGYGPAHVIDTLNRIRGPFNVNVAALAAARAAVLDQEYTQFCRAENAQWRDWLASKLQAVGIPSDPSLGNFILARFEDAQEAKAADQALQNSGIIVRRVGNYGLPEALRITIGDGAACQKVADVLGRFKEGPG